MKAGSGERKAMNETVNCFRKSQCPNCEPETSYGKEIIECKNTDCPLFSIEKDKEGENG